MSCKCIEKNKCSVGGRGKRRADAKALFLSAVVTQLRFPLCHGAKPPDVQDITATFD